MFNGGIVPGGTIDSFNPTGSPGGAGDNSLLNSLSNIATTAAKTAASVKGLFDNRPAGSPDVVGEVRFTVPQLGGLNSQTLIIGGAILAAVVVFLVLKK